MATEHITRLADDASIARTAEALTQRKMKAFVVDTYDEALAKLKELVPEGSEVFAVTSETLDDIGYTQHVAESDNYRNVDAMIKAARTPEEQMELMRTIGTTPEYVVGSVQAIAETGEVVVASASGSQMGSYTFGARHVVWVAGTQKIVPTLQDAIDRTRGYAYDRHKEWSPAHGHGVVVQGKCQG